MVRLVRIHAEGDFAPAGLAELASAGPLDVLQLDYARPRAAPVIGVETPELPELAASFGEALRSLCTTLFLEPDFRVITSAGWSNTYVGVENVAHALVAGGSPELPVSAVRGSNVMGILEFLVADGLPLDNADTGAPWRSLRETVLAADLQLGAGPIATAIEEGARVVVAGSYDGAAPAIAGAVREFGWSWQDLDRLAGAAAAARAAIWPHRHACDSLTSGGALPATHIHPRVELDENGGFTVDLSHVVDQADAQQLLDWLRAGKPRDPSHLHADVHFDARDARIVRTGPTQLHVEGCTGAKTNDHWRLEVLYQTGFLAETMVEFGAGVAASLRRQVAEAFRAHFVNADDERSLVTVQELAPPDGGAGAASWLHLACRSKSRQPCAEFVDHIWQFAGANHSIVRLPVGRPFVQAECGLWPAWVPRGAIDVAVDTRPAREWA